MKISYENVKRKIGNSFSVIKYSNAYFTAPLHIHPEYELILIEEGTGLRFVGDSVYKLSPGDFMLIGPNLAHLWLSSDEYYKTNTTLKSGSIYSQFPECIFPSETSNVPELEDVFSLLKKSSRGILFMGKNLENLKEEFRSLTKAKGVYKITGLYSLLHKLATTCDKEYLSSKKPENPHISGESDPIIEKVKLLINSSYQDDIELDELAANVGMNPSSLCRYYKRHTGKTIFNSVSELRINYAGKLLTDLQRPISEIAYDCGYNSLSHFNHIFKKKTGLSPTQYRNELKNLSHNK